MVRYVNSYKLMQGCLEIIIGFVGFHEIHAFYTYLSNDSIFLDKIFFYESIMLKKKDSFKKSAD